MGFGQSILKILWPTYVQPDLHCVRHLDRRAKNIYIKAWDGNYFQEHSVGAGVLQSSISSPMLVLLYINDFPDHVIFNDATYAIHSLF